MRTLSEYKSMQVSLRIALKKAKNPDFRAELIKAIRYAAQRVEQIENIVLHNSFKG